MNEIDLAKLKAIASELGISSQEALMQIIAHKEMSALIWTCACALLCLISTLIVIKIFTTDMKEEDGYQLTGIMLVFASVLTFTFGVMNLTRYHQVKGRVLQDMSEQPKDSK